MARVRPLYSRSRVNRAADNSRLGSFSEEDGRVIENWRASHGVVLNTFRQTLNRHTKNSNIIVAQRLKRKSTIYDKLLREPEMQLARMNDIAGCRLIFHDNDSLSAFRKNFHRSRFKHELVNSPDTYDYIKNPRQSGYRGIHDVYRYVSFSGLEQYSSWNGLRVEIQYRTQVQHAWATTVEIFDQIGESSVKYGQADERVGRFFKLASRLFEIGLESDLSQFSAEEALDLFTEYSATEEELNMHSRLLHIGGFVNRPRNLGVNGYLVLRFSTNDKTFVYVPKRKDTNSVIDLYFTIENEFPSDNVVLVRSNSSESTQKAFQNYFSNTIDFLKYSTDSRYNILAYFTNMSEKQRKRIVEAKAKFDQTAN